ncbi:MAG: hypothetical protein HRU38_10965 [Saccharospirillaceae bacterium]|nr:hypothetical protein [Saccharospirillaceae bacterium]
MSKYDAEYVKALEEQAAKMVHGLELAQLAMDKSIIQADEETKEAVYQGLKGYYRLNREHSN